MVQPENFFKEEGNKNSGDNDKIFRNKEERNESSTVDELNNMNKLKECLIQKLKSLEINSYKTFVDNGRQDESTAQDLKSFVFLTLLGCIVITSMLVLLALNMKKNALNLLNNIMINVGMGCVIQLKKGNGVISCIANEQTRFQPVQDAILEQYNGSGGETNTDCRKEFFSISDNSLTNVEQIWQETENLANGETFTYFLVESKLFTAETFAEALRQCQIRDVEITYTNVFPRDCRMFLLLPVYKGGHINSEDQLERLAFQIIAPEETTIDGGRKKDSTEEKEVQRIEKMMQNLMQIVKQSTEFNDF